MRRLRLYLDTSVIGDFDADTERGATTREFFRIVSENDDEFEIVLSPVVTEELQDAPERIRNQAAAMLESIGFILLPISAEAEDLANLYIKHGVLGERHIEDLTHIAYATLSRCDYIISWNMKHIVRAKTISAVHEFNRQNYYHCPNIATPTIITGELSHGND